MEKNGETYTYVRLARKRRVRMLIDVQGIGTGVHAFLICGDARLAKVPRVLCRAGVDYLDSDTLTHS